MSNFYTSRNRKKYALYTSILPKYLFIGIALFGAVLVCFVKAQNLDLLPTVIVPVSLIFLYCGLSWRSHYFYVKEDQIGENAYYLGFLFTLSSLAYALWDFSVANHDATSIITSFGVALWSTIVGIALRVFFSQFRQDPQDIEKESRARIAEAANILTGELQQATISFNTYTRGLQQSMQEAFHKAREAASAESLSGINALTSVIDKATQRIDTVLSDFGQQTERLNTASSSAANAMEAFEKQIKDSAAPGDVFKDKMNAIFVGIEEPAKNIQTLAYTQTESVQKLLSGSEELVQGISALNQQIEAMRTGTSVISESMGHMQSINMLVQELHKSLVQLNGDLHRPGAAHLHAVQANDTKRGWSRFWGRRSSK